MDDESDFKKARGFLLTYSALVLALWYFGADLTQFKLMGNEIRLQHRTESAWLVLGIINIYFLARCYQRVPLLGLYFDEPMNDIYDSALVWSALLWKRLELKKRTQQHFAEHFKSEGIIQLTPPTAEIPASLSVRQEREWEQLQKLKQELKQVSDQNSNRKKAPELYQVSRAERTKINLLQQYSHIGLDGHLRNPAGTARLKYEPSILFTWLVKTFAIGRGVFITPWFTDHVAPLVLGGISTILAFCNWYSINFCTSSHTYAAILCRLQP